MKLSNTFKQRNFWLGFAMLWIGYIHSGLYSSIQLLREIKSLAPIAVDMIIFASGIGCFYSLDKDPEPLRFLKRRVKRLGWVYLCFIVPWMLWRMVTGVFPKKAIVGNLLGVQSFITWEYHFNWYISGLVLFYFLSPFYKPLTDSMKKTWQDVLVVLALTAVGVAFWQCGDNMVIIARLPILYVGMVYGKMAKQGAVLGKKAAWLHGLAAFVGMAITWLAYRYTPSKLWSHGLYWYPNILIAPAFCMGLSWLAEAMKEKPVLKTVHKLITTLGVYSFEFYLVHLFFFETLVPMFLPKFSFLPGNLYWALSFLPVFLCTFLLNRAAKLVAAVYGKCVARIKV